MGLVLTTAPASEPVSTAEAKTHLRIDTTDEDIYVASLVKAARQWVEQVTRRALITQTYTLTLDDFWRGGDQVLFVPRPTLQSVTSITYVDGDGITQTWATTEYEVDTSRDPGRIVLADGKSFPTTADETNAITIVYDAGYGDAATDVPSEIVHAIKLLVGEMYCDRGNKPVAVPSAVHMLLEPHRILNERVTLVV